MQHGKTLAASLFDGASLDCLVILLMRLLSTKQRTRYTQRTRQEHTAVHQPTTTPGHTMSASRLLYGITVFLGAFLLFLVEPMAAKQLLPFLGGSSAVWLTCLVFFQVTLLLGYVYAHWITRCRASSWRQHVYLVTLAAAVVLLGAQRIFPAALSPSSDHPVTSIFATLTYTIGLPFLLLGATSPLLQLWFLRTQGGSIPYRLFALSNAGSLLALIAYPFLVEPYFPLKLQRTLWSLGFLVYAVLCAVLSPRRSPLSTTSDAQVEPIAPPAPVTAKWL